MSSLAVEELREFHRFLGEKLGAGVNWSPEQALDEWRRLHPGAAEEEDLAAILEALADRARGDQGVPFADFDRDFRSRNNLPSSP